MDNAGTFTSTAAIFMGKTGVFMDDLAFFIGDAVTSTDDSGTRTHHTVVITGSPRLCWNGTHSPSAGPFQPGKTKKAQHSESAGYI